MSRLPAARFAPTRLIAALAAALPMACLTALPADAAVVISQVYGAGGNSGATLRNDFIELFNNGSTAVSVAGWSVQYASSTGSTWQVTALPSILLQAGQYLLVQQAAGTGGTAALPTPDATGSIAMGGGAGKVALVAGTAALSGTAPTGTQDLLAYTGLTATTAALRDQGGCASNVLSAAPAPRNTASTLAPCAGAPAPAPAPAPAAAAKAIYEIQGSGATSPYVGQSVITSGVVTKLTNNGFFMQALVGDGNDATSDGILVFTSTAPTVSVGQLVQVTATVAEFATGSSTVTELTGPSITVQGSGYSIAPTPVTLPVDGGLERYEGMLVTLAGPLTVDQNYFQARYGQLTLSAGGRLETPTNRYRPGAQALALAADNAARRVVLEDGSSLQNLNPTSFTSFNGVAAAPRGGDTLGAITGVIDYGPSTATASGIGDYRILPLNNAALVYTNSHPRPATVPAVGGNVKLASFNVLNYFTTFTNGNTASGQTGQGCALGGAVSASNCRGADSLDEFNRQQAKIVAAISTINADALGLMEIQNNDVAAQNLVAALNTQMGAGTYAVAPGAASIQVGSDAIKTSIIYKPARLAPLGSSVTDTDAVNNRPTLAQHFAAANGERFTLVVNHFKSKGSCPASGDADYTGNFDAGDGQGCWNLLRTQQANRLRTFVGQLQASASGSAHVVVVGDLNAYAQEDPVYALTSNGFVDQIGRFHAFGYSYVFDGAAGRLDHAITSSALSPKVSGVAHWHINADESLAQDYNREFKQPACATCAPDPYTATVYRSSDHDPVVLGLNLYNTYLVASGTTFAGTAGDDFIAVPAGRRSLSGGAGRDQFAFAADFTGGATLTDFTPGQDQLNFKSVLQALRVNVANPWSAGYLGCTASGTSDAVITVDPDAAGPAAPRAMLLLKNVSCAAINAASFVN